MARTKQTRHVTPASNETHCMLLETLPGALFVVDDDATIVYANARAQTMLGSTRGNVYGQPFWRCASRLVSPSLYQAVQRTRQTHEPTEVAYLSPATNLWLYASLSSTPQGLALLFQEHREPQPFYAENRAEQMYRDLLESFADGVTILTPDGLILDINQRPLLDAHLRREEVVGTPYTDLPAWSSDSDVQEHLRSAIVRASTGETVRFEAHIHPRADLDLDLLMTITSHRDANQQVEYLICAGRDITERKQAEDERRTLVDAIPQFVWIAEPDGSLTYNNRRLIDYLAITHEQAEGSGWLAGVHPDDRSCVWKMWQTSIRTGEPYEVEHRMQDGTSGVYRWFLVRGVPQRNAQGTILRWVGTCTDIEDQKRVEEALRQSQERANALMNSTIIGIFVTDDDQVVEANETYLRMTGYTRDDLRQGRINWVHMTPPEYAIQTQQARQELSVTYHVTRYEKEYICKDGSRLPVVVGGVALRLNPLQVMGFVLDNSAHKELEQRKDAFISMASHELKTPLTALKLQTTLLQRQLARQGIPASAPALSSMESQINKVTRLVGELLDVSKIQAGRLEYIREPVDLDALLQEVIDTLQQTNPSHTLVVHGAVQASLIGDPDRLGQVFINLISNAIKYSPDADTVKIDLSSSKDVLTVSICDHGLGIPREQHDKIFERFYRVSGSRQKAFPGLGMGLYIVSEIVKGHGGTITVDSTIGQGSTFTVTLPRTRDV